jgi:hypothetical protein
MNHRGIWLTATVLAVIVLLAQIAGASTRDVSLPLAANATVATELITSTATTATLPEQASSVAADHAANGLAAGNAALSARGQTTTETNQVSANTPAAAPQDGTLGVRPGWGCGDTNHTHTGPPGRPADAPRPPGCPAP